MIDTQATTRRLRRRLTLFAALVIAVLTATGSVGLVMVHRAQMFRTTDIALERRADEVELLIGGGLLEQTISLPVEIEEGLVEDRAVQVVSTDGRVLAATSNLIATPSVADAPGGRQTIVTVDDLPVEDDVFRLLSRRVAGPDGTVVVHVAENVDDIEESVRILTVSLLKAVPVLVVLLTVLVWLLVGRLLRPVVSASRRQQQFVGDASHELRAPLARVRARLEVDLAHPATSDLAATGTAVLGDVVGLQRLVDDLLLLARWDEGRDEAPARRAVDLDDLVLGEVAIARATNYDDVDGAITFDTGGVSGAHVLGDSDELARLIRNLLDNARRHAGRAVTLALYERDGHAVLTVDDDGPGIPVDHRVEIFERFTRLDDARRRSDGGSGLGLAIAGEIARRHGGAITVDEAPGGGARFELRIPSAT